MGLIVDGLKLPIERWQIEEILDARLDQKKYNTKFEEFFIVAYNDKFHQSKVQTKYGRIPVFFSPEQIPTKVLILNKKKWDYPRPPHNLSILHGYDKNGDLIQ